MYQKVALSVSVVVISIIAMKEAFNQQGIILSPEEFFARNTFRIQSPFIDFTRQRGCTRRQIRFGRCPITPTTTPTGQSDNTTLSPAEASTNVEELRVEIEAFINKDHEMIPNLLQLVFHTCMGGCDGCLNFNETANKGLRITYQTIREFWSLRASILTLADMIVLMATEAVEIGMNKEGGPGNVSISFITGRKTCSNPDTYDKKLSFPHGDSTNDIEILMEEFNISRSLSIALLGAHSVGRCHLENTGFAGRWDNTELILDNHYYKSMIGTDWKSTQVQGGHQWNATRSPRSRMMLTSDLAMLKSFTINSSNHASCPTSRKCEDSDDAHQIRLYARDGSVWVLDFINAFLQMVNKGLV